MKTTSKNIKQTFEALTRARTAELFEPLGIDVARASMHKLHTHHDMQFLSFVRLHGMRSSYRADGVIPVTQHKLHTHHNHNMQFCHLYASVE